MIASMIGWVLIGCAAILLVVLQLFPFGKDILVRKEPAIEHLREAQITAMERGEPRNIVLGDQLAPLAYPGLGLQALSALPHFLNAESGVDGRLTLGSSDGGLVVFARQIVQNRYRDGFSPILHQAGVRTRLYGPTPLAFSAGILPKLGASRGSLLTLFGHYGPESMLWAEAVQRKGGQVFAAGGGLSGQAVLFLTAEDLLIGESVFGTPQMLTIEAGRSTSLIAEDILRWVLILGVLIAIGLKLGGIL